MIDIEHYSKIFGAIVGIFTALFFLMRLHRDWFIAPFIKKELNAINDNVSIIGSVLKSQFVDEYRIAEEDQIRSNKLKRGRF